MDKVKLFEVIESLTRDEINSFGDFINSPYFNKSKVISGFYLILRKYFPDYKTLTKERIFKTLFPDEEFKDKKIRDLFSKMLELLEEFLASEDLKNYPIEEKAHVLNQYNVRVLNKHFEGLTRKMISLLDKIEVKDSSFFYDSYRLKKDIRSYNEQNRTFGKRGDLLEEMNNEIDSFLIFFSHKMLSYYIELINQQKLYNQNSKLEFIDKISEFIDSRDMSSYPQVIALYTCLKMMVYPAEPEYYNRLNGLIEENRKLITKEDLKLIYIQVYNYFREKYIEGREEYVGKLFDTIKKMLAYDVTPAERGYMTPQTFINFVSVGLQVKDYNWAGSFIENYKHRISPEYTDKSYFYCIALLNYRKGQHNEALDFLAKVPIEDFYDYIRIKNQTSKIYFELGSFENLLSLIDTFRHFLSSGSDIPEYIKKRFLDYLYYLKKAVMTKLSDDSRQLQYLKKELETSEIFENKSWLLERLTI